MNKKTHKKIKDFTYLKILYYYKYEEALKKTKGKLTTRYCIYEPSPIISNIISFIMGAIFSGITYDLFKIGFNKMIKNIKPNKKVDKEWIEKLKSNIEVKKLYIIVKKSLQHKLINKKIDDILFEEAHAICFSRNFRLYLGNPSEVTKNVTNSSNVQKYVKASAEDMWQILKPNFTDEEKKEIITEMKKYK